MLRCKLLFENIIRKAGAIEPMMMQSAEKIWLLQVLTGLFDFIKEETARNPYSAANRVGQACIELMEREELVLPLIEVCGNDKGVNLVTAHGSKGLEFEYVFFAGCNATSGKRNENPLVVLSCLIHIFSVTMGA